VLLIAMDRAPASVRSFDVDGRLHVAESPISKANVCEYFGEEIPSWQRLGLEPRRVYKLLRHPDELAKAVKTFNNLQILSDHIPVTAYGDESHKAEITVGSTGTDARFDGKFLRNSLVIWAKPSIDGVVNGEKKELSSAYRYKADMTPGTFEGVDYDGIMRDIIGNHVALVGDGRAGSDVAVGDKKPMSYNSKRALMLAGGLGGLLAPKLAQDSKPVDLTPVLKNVNAKSLAAKGAVASLAATVFGLVQPFLAQDAGLEVGDVVQVIEAIKGAPGVASDEDDTIAPAADEPGKVAEDEDDEDPDEDGNPKKKDEDKPAMDTAAVLAKMKADARALRQAEREVAPVVGTLSLAMDSATDVYAAGLRQLGVDTAKLPASAYAETFRALRNAKPAIAQDSRPAATARKDFDARYANRGRLVQG